MNLNRRGFLGGLIASIAATAIVKAEILMPIRSIIRPHIYLTLSQITREAVRLFHNSNMFIANNDGIFAVDGAKIGSTLLIRLPNDYLVT